MLTMGKPPLTPSRVRSREAMEKDHQARLALPSAQDQSTICVTNAALAGNPADRFIPIRSTDQPRLDDVTPIQVQRLVSSGLQLFTYLQQAYEALREACALQGLHTSSSPFNRLLASQLGVKTPPKDAQAPANLSTPSPL